MLQKKSKMHMYFFIIYYLFIYANVSIYQVFMPLYLNNIGLNNTIIGILLGLNYIVLVFASPFFGIVSDRAKYKNNILKLLLISSPCFFILFNFSTNILYLFIIIVLFSFSQSPIYPISDTIALEYAEDSSSKFNFNHMRLAGTIGCALASIIGGFVIRNNINAMYILYTILAIIAIISFSMLPKIKGHQHNSTKVPIWNSLKNLELVLLLGLAFIVHTTVGFYWSFFPIYFKGLGADNILLGWAIFLSAVGEIPFLFFANKIINKFGIRKTVFGAAIAASARWLLMYLVQNKSFILALQLSHGLIYIVLMYSLAIYINTKMPKELKASGQTLNATFARGIGRVLGSVLGGALSSVFGIRNVFFYCSILLIVAIFLFLGMFKSNDKKVMQSVNAH